MSEKPDRPDNQDGAANPLVNRLDEAEKRIQQLEERFLKSLESAVKAHEAVAAHARWVNTVLFTLLTLLVASAGLSVWSLSQRVEERAAEMNNNLQSEILSETKTLREHVENTLENFKKTWGQRIEKLESEVARLQKR